MELYSNFKQKILNFKRHEFSSLKLGFVFGLVMRAHYLVKDHLELTKDKVELSHSLFAKEDVEKLLPQILITQNAEDNFHNSEIDHIEPGIAEHEYILKRAIEFNRPDYCLFFVTGLIRGGLNANAIREVEFVHLLEMLPYDFLKSHGKQIVEMCNYFDETGSKIKMENNKIELI